jgi:hypothetical protein
MKSKMINYYICEFCGRTSDCQEEIEACENNHVVLNPERDAMKQYFPMSGDTKHPDIITFQIQGGTILRYRRLLG